MKEPSVSDNLSWEQRRSTTQAQWLFDAIAEGLPSGQALELFRSACSRPGTLFAPSHWLKPRLLEMAKKLPSHLSAEEAEMLRDVLEQQIQIDDAVKWIGTSEPWTDYKRNVEQQRADDAGKALQKPRPICGTLLLRRLLLAQTGPQSQLPKEEDNRPTIAQDSDVRGIVSEALEIFQDGFFGAWSGAADRGKSNVSQFLSRLRDRPELAGDRDQISLALIHEIQSARVLHARGIAFDARSAYRILDSVERVLTLLGAPQAPQADKMRLQALKVMAAEASPPPEDTG